jgi:hypothetical protein
VWTGSYGLSPQLSATDRDVEASRSHEEFYAGIAFAVAASALVALMQELPDRWLWGNRPAHVHTVANRPTQPSGEGNTTSLNGAAPGRLVGRPSEGPPPAEGSAKRRESVVMRGVAIGLGSAYSISLILRLLRRKRD